MKTDDSRAAFDDYRADISIGTTRLDADLKK